MALPPPKCSEMGAFYLVFGPMELSAGLRYTTMSSKDGVGQIIKALVTVVTLVALTGGFRVIKAALDDLCGLTRWALDAVWPSQLAHCPITLDII